MTCLNRMVPDDYQQNILFVVMKLDEEPWMDNADYRKTDRKSNKRVYSEQDSNSAVL